MLSLKLRPRIEMQRFPNWPMMIQGRLPQSGGLWTWELSHWASSLLLLFPLVVSELVVVRGKGKEKGKINHQRYFSSLSLSSSPTDPPTAPEKLPLWIPPPPPNTLGSLLAISPWGLSFNICLLTSWHFLDVLLLTSGSFFADPLIISCDKMAPHNIFFSFTCSLFTYFHIATTN